MKFFEHSLTEKPYAEHGVPFPAVDIVKFICALLIVAIHTNPLEAVSGTLNHALVNYLARIAVPFFFVSSGYFLYKKTEYDNFDFGITWKFVKRIFWLYLLWSMVYFLPTMKDYITGGRTIGEAMFTWLRYFVLIGGDMQLWYLHALIVAVLLVSFCISRRMKAGHILVLSGILYLLGLLWQSYYGLFGMFEGTAIWNASEALRSVILTSRNGLFEGFFFVAIGMYFAYKPVKMKSSTAILGLLVGMVALLAEVMLVSRKGWALGTDMYLFLPLVAFFLFYVVSHIELENRPIYGRLRNMSTLIFCIHMLVYRFLPETWIVNSIVRYVAVVVVSAGIAALISVLSDKFKWLKKLY